MPSTPIDPDPPPAAEPEGRLRDLIVLLGPEKSSAVRLKLAVALAAAHRAHLIGAYLPSDDLLTRVPDEFARGEAVDRVVDHYARRETSDRAAAARQFAEAAAEARISAEWHPMEIARTAPELVAQARCADLIIVGQRPRRVVHVQIRPEDILFPFGGPVLIVPEELAIVPTPALRVLVAWNGSRESSRALGDAIPLLKRAEYVSLIIIDEPGALHSMQGDTIVGHLQRHGVEAALSRVSSAGRETGDVILDEAARTGASLIVMGAYGHSRWVETVLGSTTRQVLEHMHIPVLMSH